MRDYLCSVKKIDNLGRIVIPKDICRLAKINKNDELKIEYDDRNNLILIRKKSLHKIIDKQVEEVFLPFYKTFKVTIFITDKEKILEVFSTKKELRKFKGKTISEQLENFILDSNLSIAKLSTISLTNDFNIDRMCYYFPLKKDYCTIGCGIIIIDKKINDELLSFISTKLN